MRMKVSHVFGGSFQHNILNRHMCTHMILQLGFTEKMSFWPRLLVGYITANGWLATEVQAIFLSVWYVVKSLSMGKTR